MSSAIANTPPARQREEGPLPDGWRWARLEEVCKSDIETRDPRRSPTVLFSYVDISGVDSPSKEIVEPRLILGIEAPSRARQVMRAGDVLVATTRPGLNAIARVPTELDDQICSTGFCVLRPTSDIDSDYLFMFVRSPAFVRDLSVLVKGALYPAVTDTQMRAQRLPLPPLDQQRRIAAILNDQMAAVEGARAAAKTRLEAGRALPGAVLREMFAARQSSADPRIPLGELLTLRREVVHPRENPSGAAVFVGLEHIESGTGRRIGSLQVEKSGLSGRKPVFRKGDVVYGYLRPYLNKVWVAEFEGLCSVDQYVYVVNTSKAETHYIAWFLRSPMFLGRAPISTAPGQLPRIRTEELAAVRLELPSLQAQRRFVESLNDRLDEVQRICQSTESELAALDALTSALLRRAFSGEV